jgi:putative ABC transport system permease protein
MISIARKNLFQEKLRFAISSGGVALAIMLILVLNGLFAGMNRQITAYLDNAPVDLVISQKGLRNFLGANSIVPLAAVSQIEKVKGVKKVIPVFASYVVLELKGRREFSLLIGFDPKKGGGPWEMRKGKSDLKDDEVVFDSVVASRYDLNLGDEVDILGKKFKIVGFSGGTSSWMTGTFFITFDAASELLSAKDSAGFLLVSTDDKAGLSEIKKDIAREVENVTLLTKEEMAENDVNLFAGVFSGPLRFMVIIAFLIGVMLVGLTIYTATVERAKEYGVLKAIGIKNWKLYLIVFEQALISSIFGFFLGILLSFGAVEIINTFAPQFFILIDWPYVLEVFFVALLMSIFASYIPVRAVAKIDPAIAFRKGA